MFNNYPYTDYHELNTDWIIGKIKNVETAEANTKQYAEDADAAKVAAQDARDIAVQAKDDAVEAKDDAVEAKDDAISFLTGTKNQLDLLQARVDNIIPDGTQTAGNTELLDIRVAYDSTTYASAGDAVRAQASDLNDKITNLFYETAVSLNVIPTFYVSSADGSFVSDSSSRCADVKVTEGELYRLTSACAGSVRAVYAFMKNSSTFISARAAIDSDTDVHSYWVEIPRGCTLLRISTGGLNPGDPYVLELQKYANIDTAAFNTTSLASTYKHKNRFNINDLEAGRYFINGSNGNITSTTYNLRISNPIKIGYVKDWGEELTISTSGTLKSIYGYRFTDAEGTMLAYGPYNNQQSITVSIPQGAQYLQVTYSYVAGELTTDLQVEYGNTATTYEEYFGEYSESGIVDVVRNNTTFRPEIIISPTADIMDFYNSMLSAFNTGNCDVYITPGTYQYTDTMVEAIRADSKRGVPIGNGCRYFFDTKALIRCEYTGAQYTDIEAYFSPLDTWNTGGDFELYNLDLESKNTLYAVHDESAASNTPSRHIYQNCKIVLDNTNAHNISYNRAIGGGLGKYSEIIATNCYFNSVYGSLADVSYHGNTSGDAANIAFSNCYFEHTFGIDDQSSLYNYPDRKRLLFSGNSANSDVLELKGVGEGATWDVFSWSNTIRP